MVWNSSGADCTPSFCYHPNATYITHCTPPAAYPSTAEVGLPASHYNESTHHYETFSVGVGAVLASSPRWLRLFNADGGFSVSTIASLGGFALQWGPPQP